MKKPDKFFIADCIESGMLGAIASLAQDVTMVAVSQQAGVHFVERATNAYSPIAVATEHSTDEAKGAGRA